MDDLGGLLILSALVIVFCFFHFGFALAWHSGILLYGAAAGIVIVYCFIRFARWLS